MMFGFDERYAMFDITPVANQFILEYLPAARGDYVKVYLYGLLRCYHPEKDMSLDTMCHELNMTEDDVMSAFRYWERKRLVRRVSDKPPVWQYVNIIQSSMGPQDDPGDTDYAEFSNAVCEAFDKVRRLHGSEMSICFEWHEDMNLPTEVIIMLLNHMVDLKGRNFRISDAGKVAVRLADEDIRTVEAAEDYFLRNGKAYKGIREILRKLGKNYMPSEAQIGLYLKWTRDWHFTHEAILEALDLTAKGDPSLGYLDGILNSMRQESAEGSLLTPETIRMSVQRTDGLKEVLKEFGRGEINQRNLELYDRMTALYPQKVIETAARECGSSGKDFEETLKLLQSWKEKGLSTIQEVDSYIRSFRDQTALIRELRKTWGAEQVRIGTTDRSLVTKWTVDFGFSRELIFSAAAYASEADKPMVYLDRILTDYHNKGISSPEEARNDREKTKTEGKKNPGRLHPSQNFEQRSYSDVPGEMLGELADEMKAFKQENGGETDA